MHPRILIKSAGRTASHLLLGTLESMGYRLCWTEQHSTDSERAPLLAESGPQAWYDHQLGWPNPGVAWHCVLIRCRDRRAQILSKILSQHTQEFVFFSDRVYEPYPVTRAEWDWTARFVRDCEAGWLSTAPSPVTQLYREDIIQDPQNAVSQLGIAVVGNPQSRFPINPRSLESLCANWAETQNWPLPDLLI
jgi:hypothetical protein